MKASRTLLGFGLASMLAASPGCAESDKTSQSDTAHATQVAASYSFGKLAPNFRQELIERNPGAEFSFGEVNDTSIENNFERLGARMEYPVLMDGEQIGTLTTVRISGFNNTVYRGRVPGYVNQLMVEGKEFDKRIGREPDDTPIDFVSLQYTISGPDYSGSRKDGCDLDFP